MIAIVDYGMGNLKSVEKGFKKLGIDARVAADPFTVYNAKGIVLPGVGAFKDCVKNLADTKLADSIKRSVTKGKPFLGICLGLQVLFTESDEFGKCKGFDIFKGKVVRFPKNELKVPHMGWNAVNFVNKPPIFEGIEDSSYFYFVHSFYVVPESEDIIACKTDYGITFTSMIWKDNVFAVQFHPEKSQEAGLKLLKGFGEFVKKA